MSDGTFRASKKKPDLSYHEIDWWQKAVDRARAEDYEVPIPMEFIDPKGNVIPVNQETCFIYMSEADDDADCIQLIDPKDELSYLWFRGEIGDERFDTICLGIGRLVTMVCTLVPGKGIVDQYEATLLQDVRNIDHVPEGWDG